MAEVGVSPDKLEREVSEEHLLSISKFLSWRRVAPYLKLGEVEEGDIEMEGKSEAEKRLILLRRWKSTFAFKATYKVLINTLLSIPIADQAARMCRLLTAEEGRH